MEKTPKPLRNRGSFMEWLRVQVSLHTVHPWTERGQKPIVLGIFRKQVPWLSAPENTKVIQKVIHSGKRKTPDRSQGNFFTQEVFQYGNQILVTQRCAT